MKRMIAAGVLLVGLVAAYQITAGANGSPVRSTPPTESRVLTVEERAIEAYNSGIARRDRGQKYEQEAARKTGTDQQRAEQRARDEYLRALKEFERAAQMSPKLFQAYNGMGYALRKTGDYTRALEMYDRAIEMAPGLYTEAIEYRGEAYLGLNRIDDAKQAYLDLFGSDRKQADALLQQMKIWIGKRKAEPAGVDPAALAGFETWVSERAGIAQVTARMAVDGPPSTW
jgi:tetratricopeptide (TPR) repeat protein